MLTIKERIERRIKSLEISRERSKGKIIELLDCEDRISFREVISKEVEQSKQAQAAINELQNLLSEIESNALPLRVQPLRFEKSRTPEEDEAFHREILLKVLKNSNPDLYHNIRTMELMKLNQYFVNFASLMFVEGWIEKIETFERSFLEASERVPVEVEAWLKELHENFAVFNDNLGIISADLNI